MKNFVQVFLVLTFIFQSSFGHIQHNENFIKLLSELRRENIDRIIELPNIAIVGSQSSGKSSVIESVTGISVPRNEDTCTKMPMEIRTSKADEFYAEIQIYKDGMKEYFSNTSFPHELEGMISRAQAKAIPSNTVFSEDPLIIYVEGPTYTDLAVTDLPGLINYHRDQKQAGEVVKKIVDSYVEKTNTIIMVLLNCEKEYQSEPVFEYLKSIPDSAGILSKPDKCSKPMKDLVPEIFGCGHGFESKRGWYTLKNPDQTILEDLRQARLDQDFTAAKKILKGFYDEEMPFFEQSDTFRDILQEYPDRIGRDNVVKFLVKRLDEAMRDSLPEIAKTLKRSETEYEAKVEALKKKIDIEEAFGLLRTIFRAVQYQLDDGYLLSKRATNLSINSILDDKFPNLRYKLSYSIPGNKIRHFFKDQEFYENQEKLKSEEEKKSNKSSLKKSFSKLRKSFRNSESKSKSKLMDEEIKEISVEDVPYKGVNSKIRTITVSDDVKEIYHSRLQSILESLKATSGDEALQGSPEKAVMVLEYREVFDSWSDPLEEFLELLEADTNKLNSEFIKRARSKIYAEEKRKFESVILKSKAKRKFDEKDIEETVNGWLEMAEEKLIDLVHEQYKELRDDVMKAYIQISADSERTYVADTRLEDTVDYYSGFLGNLADPTLRDRFFKKIQENRNTLLGVGTLGVAATATVTAVSSAIAGAMPLFGIAGLLIGGGALLQPKVTALVAKAGVKYLALGCQFAKKGFTYIHQTDVKRNEKSKSKNSAQKMTNDFKGSSKKSKKKKSIGFDSDADITGPKDQLLESKEAALRVFISSTAVMDMIRKELTQRIQSYMYKSFFNKIPGEFKEFYEKFLSKEASEMLEEQIKDSDRKEYIMAKKSLEAIKNCLEIINSFKKRRNINRLN